MKVVFLYVHDEKGFGHLSRMTKIYDLLDGKYKPIFLIGGTLHPPEGRRFYKMPYATEFENYSDGGKQDRENLQKRKSFLEDILSEYETYDFLIDYFPFGRIVFSDEIDMLIEKTHQKGGKFYTVMRDIFTGIPRQEESYYREVEQILVKHGISIDIGERLYPDVQRKIYSVLKEYDLSHGAVNIFLNYYLTYGGIDGVLVFGDNEVYDIRDEFNLSNDVRTKFIFLGYLVSKKQINTTRGTEKTPYILICFGGNVFDKKTFITLLSACSQIGNIRFKVVLGSMMEEKEIFSIREKFEVFEHMEILNFIDHFHEVLYSARVFIGAGGYGTLMDLVSYQIPSFLFVNQNNVVKVNETEQKTRIQVLGDYGPIELSEKVDINFMKDIIAMYFRERSKSESFPHLKTLNSNILDKYLMIK